MFDLKNELVFSLLSHSYYKEEAT